MSHVEIQMETSKRWGQSVQRTLTYFENRTNKNANIVVVECEKKREVKSVILGKEQTLSSSFFWLV